MFEGLTFKVADASERVRALELRRQLYSLELGHHGLDDLDEHAYHLIACESDGTVVAALRVLGPNQRPFDLEQFVRLSDFFAPGRSLAELSRFCVQPDSRQVQSKRFVHLGMFKLLHSFACRNALTDLVTLGLPHLKNVYRMAFFRPLGATCDHPIWGLTQPMHLDLTAIEAQYSQSKNPIARLLLKTDLPNIIV